MDFDSNYSSNEFRQQFQHSETSSRGSLLRFRSAPGSLFANFTDGLLPSRFNLNATKCNNNENGYKDDGYGMNSQLPPQYPRKVEATQVESINGGFRVESSMGMDQPTSNLLRQNSSPIGMLSRMSEPENENYGLNTGADDEERLGNENGGNDQFYSSSYPFGAWNDSLNFEENLTGIIKMEVDDGVKSFDSLKTAEVSNRPPVLSHHLSLRKSFSDLADTIPCKIRAKRGCATHPRSIAERVRRTKISERMRKLQDLVPNMDKQTNTADMLDLAVEYIKDLQHQHKRLAKTRADCKCTM